MIEIPRHKRFCLTLNLREYFGLEGLPINEWQIYLGLRVPGFEWYGVAPDRVDYFIGIRGDCQQLLDSLLEALDLERHPSLAPPGPNAYLDAPQLVTVDDYYLPYSPYFAREHYERVAVAIPDEAQGWALYDYEARDLPAEALAGAVTSAFRISWGATTNATGVSERIYESLNDESDGNGWFDQLDEFAKAVERESGDWESLVLKTMFFCTNRPSGPTIIRREMGNALEALAQQTDSARLATASAAYFDVAEKWERIGGMFYALSKNLSSGRMDALRDSVREAVRDERELPL